MAVKRVDPSEAKELLDQGWAYLDVRSVAEFEAGHPEGAYNVPLMHKSASGMTDNPDFARVVDAQFAKDARLVIGCRSGVRSLRAAEMLIAQGYQSVVDMRGGFGGERAPTGAVVCAGWQERDLPVATSAEPGRSYDDLERA